MTEAQIQKIIENQKKFFATGKTLDVKYRKDALKKLKSTIEKYEVEIGSAIKADLGKSASESYMCEIGLVKSEIAYMIKHLGKFAKEKTVKTPITNWISRSFVKPVPYGNVLIMSPWNYPFLLAIDPLADALAAGNTAVVKPSAYSAETSNIIKKIIEECFEPEYVCVVEGGRAENQHLLKGDFNYIFFTGSKSVGKEVMANAAEKLIPVTLELGGKSPCIVDESANIKLAAKRIVFGKFINCGQTCVAPDYIYCHKNVKEQLVEEIKKQIVIQYGENPLENESYGKIINEKHFERICKLINDQKVVIGGKYNKDTLKIEPTLMTDVVWDDAVMGEEIFGPVLPLLTFDNIHDVADKVNSTDSPLALYIFASDKKLIKYVTSHIQYGGGCINDTIVHLATTEMGFGGVGASGMGTYHGKHGFDTFTHYKSIMDKKTFLDLPMRYQPYNKLNDKLIKMFLK